MPSLVGPAGEPVLLPDQAGAELAGEQSLEQGFRHKTRVCRSPVQLVPGRKTQGEPHQGVVQVETAGFHAVRHAHLVRAADTHGLQLLRSVEQESGLDGSLKRRLLVPVVIEGGAPLASLSDSQRFGLPALKLQPAGGEAAINRGVESGDFSSLSE